MELTLDQLKIHKAKQEDWKAILEILEETGLAFWLSGKENYKSFYIIRNASTEEIICCFSIESEDNIGTLKSFAVRKKLHGKGVGKLVVKGIPKIAKELELKKLYACSWEAPAFWRKTDFFEIIEKDVKDQFYLKYINNLEKNFPKHYKDIKHFLLTIK